MIYRTILANFDIDAPREPQIEYARRLASMFEADLIGFAACYPQAIIVAADGMSVGSELLGQEMEAIEAGLADFRLAFESATIGDTCASWRGFLAEPSHLIAEHARAADLIVTSAPSEGRAAALDLGTVLLAAGRPVLVSAGKLEPVKAEQVVVGWKDAREARRAVTDALPFLVGANDVIVASVVEGNSQEVLPGLSDTVRFLIKHGAKARSRIIPSTSDVDAGDELLSLALECGADLVVSGGFGHSRLREWVFGGVTRTLMDADSTNRLFSN